MRAHARHTAAGLRHGALWKVQQRPVTATGEPATRQGAWTTGTTLQPPGLPEWTRSLQSFIQQTRIKDLPCAGPLEMEA